MGTADAFDPGANDFGYVSAAEAGQNQNARQIAVLHADGIENDVVADENLHQQRRAADQFDVDFSQIAQGQKTAALRQSRAESGQRTANQSGGGKTDGREPALQEEPAVGIDGVPPRLIRQMLE